MNIYSSAQARRWLTERGIRQLKRSELENIDSLLFLMPQEFLDACAKKKKYLNFLLVKKPINDNEYPEVKLYGSDHINSYVISRDTNTPRCVWTGKQAHSYQLYRSHIYVADPTYFPHQDFADD